MKNKVPKLRFPEFSGEWEEKELGKICDVIMGQSPNSLAYNENLDGLPLIQGNADCKKRKIIPRLYTSEITKESLPKDIIMSVRAPAGTIAKSDIHSCIGRGVCAIRNKFENQEYVYQYLINYEDKWSKYSQGSTFDSINSTDVKGLDIFIPSLPEQEKIALFLSEVDIKIEKLEKKKELLSQYKKGMMQKLFSQKLRFKDENGNDYPEWEEKRLGEIADIRTGKKDLINKVDDGQYPFFVRSKNIEKINSYSFDGEAILIPGDGQIGQVYHYINGKFDYHQRVYKISDFISGKGKYIYYYLQEKFMKHALENTSKATVDSLRLPIIKEFLISVPSLPEQEKIANFLSSIDRKIELVEEELEKNKEFKKGLLQQMFA
ncbi:MAG: restriction endonuclease subunit S [Clostridium sp.]